MPKEESLVVASQVYPSRLPVISLEQRPAFPRTVTSITLTGDGIRALVETAAKNEQPHVGLVHLDSDPPTHDPASPKPHLHRVGVVGQLMKAERDGPQVKLIVGGLDRFEITSIEQREPYVVASVRYLYEPHLTVDDELKAYALAVMNLIKELVQLNPLFKEELSLLLSQGATSEPARLADFAAYLTSAKGAELQAVLETMDVRDRLVRVADLLRRELDIAKLHTKIRAQIDERVSKQQREFFLREQLKAIKSELGLEKDDKETELTRFRERLANKSLSDEGQARVEEELTKLSLLDVASPEFNLTRTYLDWLTVLPWGTRSDAAVSLESARAALEAHHHGLEDVKARILEFIAAGMLRGSFGGSIVLLVGPPGVGKTSIGKSIARALGRQFYRFSLGGMRDEAEIKGHRRTYVGAMPGKFLQSLRVCGSDDPVLMLDEIDKVGSSFRGDPAAALLEALDPEQNREFLDHYLDVRYDLSNVLFVATANQLDTIPPALLDRMEVIRLSGYLLEDKLEIAQRHLLPRELASLKLDSKRLTITRAALREVIDGYARDAGLRSLEQELKRIIRKSALKIVETRSAPARSREHQRIKIDAADVESLLGMRRFRDEASRGRAAPGVVLGLAWTSLGGDTLAVEARAVDAKSPGFKQTGQLGKVMVESSEIAYTVVRALLADEGGDRAGFFDGRFVHLHVPAGATPKDGPSAGITMATALYSLATGRAPKARLAMTGELDLSGNVLPVGGIREKVIAAKRAKVKRVVLPKANEGDWERLPEAVRRGLEVHLLERLSDVLDVAVR